jgi:hypothetical protein
MTNTGLQLNLPAFGYKIKQKDDKLFIYDVLRKKYVVLQPEEWVRQHFMHYLINEKKVSRMLIKVEHGSKYANLQKRCDIIVWDTTLKPQLIIECKAPHIPINSETLFQLGIYNSGLNAPYLGLTNGLSHYYYKRVGEEYIKLDELPEFN